MIDNGLPGQTPAPEETSPSVFRIGNGVGPFGRWFRLFAGIDTLVYLSINPVLLHPVPAGELGAHFARVGAWFLAIAAAYLAGVWMFGRRLFGRGSPWLGTAVFLGVPTLLRILGIVPVSFQIAFGFYVGVSLIGTFFMRYGGCEVVAFPSLVLGRRYTMYCPYNAVDAVERAVALDGYSVPHRFVAILSLATTLLVGGYFLVERISGFFGRFGLGFSLDDRLAWSLFLPAGYLTWMAVASLVREKSLRAPSVRKFGLGALVLTAVTISLVAPDVDSYVLWLAVLAVGVVYAIGDLVVRSARFRVRSSPGGRSPSSGQAR